MDGYLENCDVCGNWMAKAGVRPPQTLLGVRGLFIPDLRIEIEVTAAA
jgi:enamine deaminase RidA (YjgF/YER057c/UK114 family)